MATRDACAGATIYNQSRGLERSAVAVAFSLLTGCGGGDSNPAQSGTTGLNTATATATAIATSAGSATSANSSTQGATATDSSAPTTGGIDPGAEACPWILDGNYGHSSDAFFEPSQVIRIDVQMDAADWQFQLDNPDLEEYREAAVTFCGQRVDGAGMRFKKSTHPNADLTEGYAKNPMVLDINRFAPGQKLRGLRKINLEYGNDMMLVAERLNWELLASFGVTSSRANYAQLYINDEYIGAFANIERVDRSFANYHFGNNDGQLYKHAYCATFNWNGSNASDYTGDERCYAPKPSDSVTDYSDLINVIDVLNNTADADLEATLPGVWNVDAWIPMMAALQVLGYGDTPNANGNNFYTYHPSPPGPAEVALWDLDGGYWRTGQPCESGADTTGWDLFRIASCFNNLPLFHRVVGVDAWRERYLQRAKDFLDGPFEPTVVSTRMDELVDMLAPALAGDPNRSGDDAQWADDVASLKNLQQLRADNVRQQLIVLGVR